ncbi:MAG: tRNA (N6-isopentenyl adenosine(37)-C2)-methylthiotransferase MiaB [Candidatus Dadabacteria bacterium]|nr:MAG: tRNA (N6-isopentenyl adenosine(37)-C2)-methylthiotransferase MiaB [Candidatus Dadabacteria bacterium]
MAKEAVKEQEAGLFQADADKACRKKVYIKTFGCQMNEYDTQKVLKVLSSEYEPVNSPCEADLVIINTCSVREKPEHKVYSLAGEIRALKKRGKRLLLGVGGCVAQQEGQNLVKRNKEIDFVFGTHNISLVPSLIRERLRTGLPQVAVNYREEWEELPLGFVGDEKCSVFVAISRGCNKNCTYCVVPNTRGREVSRPAEEILREVKIAAYRGAKEVVLLGQTVNSWGKDLIPRKRFEDLLELVSTVEGIKRIRFTSPHPQEVREDFIRYIADNPKVCRHIHLPVQSGSDKILKLMKRNYRIKKYLKIVEQLYKYIPEIKITTDVIVGFPQETEEDFKATLSVLEEVRFLNSYSFLFSPRPNTKAAEMKDDTPREEKLRRLYMYQKRQEEITAELLYEYLGRKTEVLIEGVDKAKKGLRGRNQQNIFVHLPYKADQVGRIKEVRVVEVGKHSLRAEYCK